LNRTQLDGQHFVDLKHSAFEEVNTLQVFIPENQVRNRRTELETLTFFGSPMESTPVIKHMPTTSRAENSGWKPNGLRNNSFGFGPLRGTAVTTPDTNPGVPTFKGNRASFVPDTRGEREPDNAERDWNEFPEVGRPKPFRRR